MTSSSFLSFGESSMTSESFSMDPAMRVSVFHALEKELLSLPVKPRSFTIALMVDLRRSKAWASA
jgi:hypothetical protein